VTLFGLFLTPVFYVTLRKFVTRGKPVEDVSARVGCGR
jgi:multidrug efflux pump